MIVVTQSGTVGTVNTLDSSIVLVEAIQGENLFELIGDDKLLCWPAGPLHWFSMALPASSLFFLNPEDATGFQVH